MDDNFSITIPFHWYVGMSIKLCTQYYTLCDALKRAWAACVYVE